jgi:hypothetical protein
LRPEESLLNFTKKNEESPSNAAAIEGLWMIFDLLAIVMPALGLSR